MIARRYKVLIMNSRRTSIDRRYSKETKAQFARNSSRLGFRKTGRSRIYSIAEEVVTAPSISRRISRAFVASSTMASALESTRRTRANVFAYACSRATCVCTWVFVCRGVNWIKQHATSSVYTAGSSEVKSVMGWPLIHHVADHWTPIHRRSFLDMRPS